MKRFKDKHRTHYVTNRFWLTVGRKIIISSVLNPQGNIIGRRHAAYLIKKWRSERALR